MIKTQITKGDISPLVKIGESTGRLGNFFWILSFSLLFVLALSASGYIFRQGIYLSGPTNTVNQSPSPIGATPLPLASPSADLKMTYFLEIQNGSGISGRAAVTKNLLEKLDYRVSKTTNADRTNYQETVIQAGNQVDLTFLKQLSQNLEKTYQVGDTIEPLPEAERIVVIIGKL